LLIGTAIAATGLALRRFRGKPGAYVAICATLISAVFWFTEVISLHQTDAILEHPAGTGSIMRIMVVWIVSFATTAVGILMDAKGRTVL